jgi:hypothetical protein
MILKRTMDLKNIKRQKLNSNKKVVNEKIYNNPIKIKIV